MSISASRVTRFGIAGQIWRPAGSFSGKVAGPPVFSGTIPDIAGSVGDSDIVTDLSGYFSGATSYSIAPAVEAGWNFDTVTGILTVDTDEANTFGTYVVTGTNAGGSDDSNAFNVIIAESASSGGFWFAYDNEYKRRGKDQKKRKKKKEKSLEVQDELERELALVQRELEAKEARKKELDRLTRIVERQTLGEASNERLEKVAQDAIKRRTYSAMERLEREIAKVKEEEEFLMQAIEIILNA